VKLTITITEHNRASRSRSQSGSRHLRYFTRPIPHCPLLPQWIYHVTNTLYSTN